MLVNKAADLTEFLYLSLYFAALISFAALLWGCAGALLRPATQARSPWFAGSLISMVVSTWAVGVAFLAQTTPQPVAPASAAALVIQGLLVWGGAGLILLFAVLRTLWVVRAPTGNDA